MVLPIYLNPYPSVIGEISQIKIKMSAIHGQQWSMPLTTKKLSCTQVLCKFTNSTIKRLQIIKDNVFIKYIH